MRAAGTALRSALLRRWPGGFKQRNAVGRGSFGDIFCGWHVHPELVYFLFRFFLTEKDTCDVDFAETFVRSDCAVACGYSWPFCVAMTRTDRTEVPNTCFFIRALTAMLDWAQALD